ncbi:MAG TPA: SDR family NAD(P)-dependent oxidoreductase [Gemmatimonadales bacterium]|nr:SDR family NAD(P)-dependent oxidoreductase [Gemmatimonadales bacterium]
MGADFRGKTALVTGVGRVGQIGHAVALGLGKAGARLVLADLQAQSLNERQAELRALGYEVHVSAGDLTTPEAARRAVAVATDWGGLDVVINVAGGLVSYGPVLDLAPERFEREFAVNVKTAFYVCQAAIPALLLRGTGAIVNFASIAILRPQPEMAAYTAAKAAVAGLTAALAREFAGRLRVNAVAPAAARTGDNVAHMGKAQHLLSLDELVRVVLYLASDDAQGVSGQVVAVTGEAA